MKTTHAKYTREEIEIEAMLSKAANEEGTLQSWDMLAIALGRPELHTTMSVSSAFRHLAGKDYDTDFFCD